MNDLILVTGAARSGMSIIAGVIHLCGAWGGDFPQMKIYDGRGSFENLEIRDALMKPFLRGIKADPLGQRPLPDIRRCRELNKKLKDSWRRRVEAIVRSQGYKKGPIFIANPQMALLWPIWHQAFPNAQWVLVRRNDDYIIASCMKTKFMSGYDSTEGWQKWMDAHKRRFSEMVEAGLNIWQIWTQKVIDGKIGDLKILINHLGLSWDQSKVKIFLEPITWREGVFEINDG